MGKERGAGEANSRRNYIVARYPSTVKGRGINPTPAEHSVHLNIVEAEVSDDKILGEHIIGRARNAG